MSTYIATSLRRAPSPPVGDDELEALRRRAWASQGVLAVKVDDNRLTWPERELLQQVGAKFYGPRGSK